MVPTLTCGFFLSNFSLAMGPAPRSRLAVKSYVPLSGGGGLLRHLVRVHLVVAAVEELHLQVDHRISGEHAALHRLLDTLADGRDIFLGDHAALDLVDELEPPTLGTGADPQPDVAVLAAPAA